MCVGKRFSVSHVNCWANSAPNDTTNASFGVSAGKPAEVPRHTLPWVWSISWAWHSPDSLSLLPSQHTRIFAYSTSGHLKAPWKSTAILDWSCRAVAPAQLLGALGKGCEIPEEAAGLLQAGKVLTPRVWNPWVCSTKGTKMLPAACWWPRRVCTQTLSHSEGLPRQWQFLQSLSDLPSTTSTETNKANPNSDSVSNKAQDLLSPSRATALCKTHEKYLVS